jgi:hypothetical protein
MIKYYMRPDSNTPPQYSYVVGEDTDCLWNADTCIEVTPQPTINHIYNMDTSAWELSETCYMVSLRYKRDSELKRTDKHTFADYPISADDLVTVKTYRQALRDCPNKEAIEDRVLPECPEVCK